MPEWENSSRGRVPYDRRVTDPLETLTAESASRYVGQRFAVPAMDVELELTAIEQRGGEAAGARPGGPFSLLFAGPAEPLLPQATYELGHEELGTFGIFLVPVGRTADAVEYEAAFS